MMRLQRRAFSLKYGLPAALAAALLAAPLALDHSGYGHWGSQVYAKGGEGGGHGGGGGGGRDGGHGGDHDGGLGGGHGSDHGRDHRGGFDGDDDDRDWGRGEHANRGHGHDDPDDDSGHGSDRLGRLNAAHASSTAREHAAENSAVGQLAHYKSLVESTTDSIGEQAAAALDALKAAGNKVLSLPVIDEVNQLLEIDEPNPVVDEMKTQLEAEQVGEPEVVVETEAAAAPEQVDAPGVVSEN